MSTPSQPDEHASQGIPGASGQPTPQQYGAPASPQQYGTAAPQQHAGSAPQYGSPQQHGAPQQYAAPQQYTAPQQYSSPQQYGSPQQYPSAPQQSGSAPQQYAPAAPSGSAQAPADPVKKQATVGIVLAAGTVVLGLALSILQTVLLRVLIENGSYDAYGAVTTGISWLGVLATVVLGVIALILGLSAAKTGQHQVRSGIAIGAGALAVAGAVVNLIQFLLNFALNSF